jgi:hypothetical protein
MKTNQITNQMIETIRKDFPQLDENADQIHGYFSKVGYYQVEDETYAILYASDGAQYNESDSRNYGIKTLTDAVRRAYECNQEECKTY